MNGVSYLLTVVRETDQKQIRVLMDEEQFGGLNCLGVLDWVELNGSP